jgi:YesN/AraC family two-component response regulator
MKNFYIRSIILLLCLPAFVPGRAEGFQAREDSLLVLIPTLAGEEKLDAYNRLHSLYFDRLSDKNSLDAFLSFSALYREECLKQDRMQRAGDLLVSDIIACTKCYRFDELEKRAVESMAFLKSHRQTEGAYVVYNQLILAYCRRNLYDKALSELQQTCQLAEAENDRLGQFYAHYLMGIVYMHQDRLGEAEQNYRQSIDLVKGIEPRPRKLIDVYMQLCNMLQATERFDDFFAQAQQAETLLKQLETQNERKGFATEWENLWTLYAFAHDAQGNYDDAEIYCNRIDSVNNGNPVSMGNTTYIRSHILDARGQYAGALEQIDRAIALDPTYLFARYTKVKILSHLEKAPQTWAETEKTVNYADSVRNAAFNEQLDELRTRYEVDKHIAEKEKTRNYLLFALAGCLLLAVAWGIWIYLNRRIAAKNRSLYMQIQELMQKEKAMEQILLEAPEEELSRSMQLFRKMSERMQAEKTFTDPELNRKKLADLLHTNEVYLADAIREATGETFSAYLSGIRLQYTLQLMNEHPRMPLDTVAVDSGHGSYASFFRLFTKKYGVTPSEYHKMSALKKKK